MAYLQQTSWKERPGAVAGVLAIHALIGYALVNGLTLNAIVDGPERLRSEFIDDFPLDPPPPPPPEEVKSEIVPKRLPVAPLPPLDLSERAPVIDTTPIILPPIPTPRAIPSPVPTIDVGPRKPAFEPVAPRPRNEPGNWVTTADYRSSWINREWTGTARVRLAIAANGRVEDCAVTGSSGQAELDRATCELVTRRARFEPARDANGEKTAGTYATAVRWELPR